MSEHLSQNRLEKEKLIKEINDEIKDSSIIVVNQQTGLNADQTRSLRVAMRTGGVGLKIAKNTLIKHVIANGPFSALEKFLQGPTVLAFSKDPISAAKVSSEFAKKNDKFTVVGAVMNGELMEAQQVKVLASLPSLDELRAKIIGLVQAPATKIAGVLQAPAGQLARVMSARSKQGA